MLCMHCIHVHGTDLSHGPNSVYIAAITLSVKFVSITVVILSKLPYWRVNAGTYRL